MANIEMLERVIAVIQADPSVWKQESWQRCVAGIACNLSEQEPSEWVGDNRLAANDFDQWEETLPLVKDDDAFLRLWAFNPPLKRLPKRVTSIRARATRLLQLTPEEAGYLFQGHRTLHEIIWFVQERKFNQDYVAFQSHPVRLHIPDTSLDRETREMIFA